MSLRVIHETDNLTQPRYSATSLFFFQIGIQENVGCPQSSRMFPWISSSNWEQQFKKASKSQSSLPCNATGAWNDGCVGIFHTPWNKVWLMLPHLTVAVWTLLGMAPSKLLLVCELFPNIQTILLTTSVSPKKDLSCIWQYVCNERAYLLQLISFSCAR